MKLNEELLFFYEWDANIRQKADDILNERYAGIEYNTFSLEEGRFIREGTVMILTAFNPVPAL